MIFSNKSANFNIIFFLKLGSDFDQLPFSNAFLDTLTAKSTSSFCEKEILLILLPSMGEKLSNDIPEIDS